MFVVPREDLKFLRQKLKKLDERLAKDATKAQGMEEEVAALQVGSGAQGPASQLARAGLHYSCCRELWYIGPYQAGCFRVPVFQRAVGWCVQEEVPLLQGRAEEMAGQLKEAEKVGQGGLGRRGLRTYADVPCGGEMVCWSSCCWCC